MNEYWMKARDAWQALATRERALLLAAVIAALYGAIDTSLLHPMDIERLRIETELSKTTSEVTKLDERTRTLAKQVEEGISGPIEREERALRRQIELLNQRVEERISAMIPPGEVTRMLEALLTEESELTLVKLSSIERPPARQTTVNAADTVAGEPQVEAPEFYRHGFRIELEGNYLATLSYLEAIEGLSWDLSWDRIVYEVIEYPRARVSIELHTVSDEENWIGV